MTTQRDLRLHKDAAERALDRLTSRLATFLLAGGGILLGTWYSPVINWPEAIVIWSVIVALRPEE